MIASKDFFNLNKAIFIFIFLWSFALVGYYACNQMKVKQDIVKEDIKEEVPNQDEGIQNSFFYVKFR